MAHIALKNDLKSSQLKASTSEKEWNHEERKLQREGMNIFYHFIQFGWMMNLSYLLLHLDTFYVLSVLIVLIILALFVYTTSMLENTGSSNFQLALGDTMQTIVTETSNHH